MCTCLIMNIKSRTVLFLFLRQWSLVVIYKIGKLNATETLKVNVIVHDIKEPPLIEVSADNVKVTEKARLNSVLFTLFVIDLDASVAGGSVVYNVSMVVEGKLWFLSLRDGCL